MAKSYLKNETENFKIGQVYDNRKQNSKIVNHTDEIIGDTLGLPKFGKEGKLKWIEYQNVVLSKGK